MSFKRAPTSEVAISLISPPLRVWFSMATLSPRLVDARVHLNVNKICSCVVVCIYTVCGYNMAACVKAPCW